MSLEGKLKDFGIADILQLLAQQQKTGILLVEHRQESAEIYFLNGLVIETRSSQHSDRLGAMLIRGGYVTSQQIDSALANQGDTFDYLGKILVQNGLLQHEVLQQALFTQTIETFFDILQWSDGQYKFITDKFKKQGVLENIPGVQSILLDVLRMIDEWPEIKKVIPSLEIIYELHEDHSADDIEVDELPVYQLINGKNSVQDIVDGSLLGRYAACKILVELLQDSIIKSKGHKKSGDPEQYHKLIDTIFGTGAYIVLLLIVLFAFFLPTGFPASVLPVPGTQAMEQSPVHFYRAKVDYQRIRYALDAYKCKYSYYPESLSELVNTGLIAQEMLSDTITYETKQAYYMLVGD